MKSMADSTGKKKKKKNLKLRATTTHNEHKAIKTYSKTIVKPKQNSPLFPFFHRC